MRSYEGGNLRFVRRCLAPEVIDKRVKLYSHAAHLTETMMHDA